MKRLTALGLALIVAFGLWGCKSWSEKQNEAVCFYYQRIDYSYGEEDSVIAAETRELSGYRDNLRYLMTLYFHGPQDPGLFSPFPSGISVVDIRTEDDTLVVSLNSALNQLQDLDLTIACTCLARTCFELADVQQILIESPPTEDGSFVSISISRDQYLLTDSIPSTTSPTQQTD